MTVMLDITKDPWTGDSTWTIIRADLDLQHVFAEKTRITFKFNDGGFNVVPVGGPTKIAECFKERFLRRVGSVPLTLDDVDGVDTLANFDALSATARSDVMDTLAQHVDPKKDLLRLEGMISMLCHETAAQLAAPPAKKPQSTKKPHSPLQVETKICVYQINDAAANTPFLLIRAPSSPECPLANGDGSVVGQP
jgi:hypothetical protein